MACAVLAATLVLGAAPAAAQVTDPSPPDTEGDLTGVVEPEQGEADVVSEVEAGPGLALIDPVAPADPTPPAEPGDPLASVDPATSAPGPEDPPAPVDPATSSPGPEDPARSAPGTEDPPAPVDPARSTPGTEDPAAPIDPPIAGSEDPAPSTGPPAADMSPTPTGPPTSADPGDPPASVDSPTSTPGPENPPTSVETRTPGDPPAPTDSPNSGPAYPDSASTGQPELTDPPAPTDSPDDDSETNSGMGAQNGSADRTGVTGAAGPNGAVGPGDAESDLSAAAPSSVFRDVPPPAGMHALVSPFAAAARHDPPGGWSSAPLATGGVDASGWDGAGEPRGSGVAPPVATQSASSIDSLDEPVVRDAESMSAAQAADRAVGPLAFAGAGLAGLAAVGTLRPGRLPRRHADS